MIIIPFSPGSFGSLVEYCIREFSVEFKNLRPISFLGNPIKDDGSVHRYKKLNHPVNKNELKSAIQTSSEILTPIYPMKDIKSNEIIKFINLFKKSTDTILLIKISNYKWAEINFLFKWYKIWKGLNFSHTIIHNDVEKIKSLVTKWNSEYKTFDDFKTWEFREFLSLYYYDFIKNDIIDESIPSSITNEEIITNTHSTILKVFDLCNLTIDRPEELKEFINYWRDKQQYVLNEYYLIDDIVNNTIDNKSFSWNLICLFSEAIVQKRLRDSGYELKCYDLNEFPTNAKQLNQLLEKI